MGALFTAGAFAGAVTVMAALWLLGAGVRPPDRGALLALGGVAVLLALRDAGLVRLKLPQRHHQVKRETLLNHPVYGVFSFGFALGTAFWTFVSVSAPYLLFALVPMLSLPELAFTGAAFAIGRGVSVIARMFVRVDEDEVVERLMLAITNARTISAIALAFYGGTLLRGAAGS